jgi:SAM-dependent methyltransferase
VTPDDLVRRRARQLAAQAAASGDPAGWFETLYAEARDGQAVVPWDDGQPNPHLTEWAATAAGRAIAGPGRRALVVGCGTGGDPAFLAGLGCEVTAFDVSPTAIAAASERFPGAPVDYQVADLLAPPPAWHGAFDLVAEIYTVQALYGPARAAAIQTLPGLVTPGGTLLAIARATDDQDPVRDPALMPWPLTRRELQAMAGRTLTAGPVEQFLDAEDPPKLRWRAQFTRR